MATDPYDEPLHWLNMSRKIEPKKTKEFSRWEDAEWKRITGGES